VIDTTTGTPTGQRAWFAWARVGADSINDLAFRMLQNKTS
jgi:predicted phage gp36 major capsid-like protein